MSAPINNVNLSGMTPTNPKILSEVAEGEMADALYISPAATTSQAQAQMMQNQMLNNQNIEVQQNDERSRKAKGRDINNLPNKI